MNAYTNELKKLLDKIAYMHTPREVFKDFIEMSALSISNSTARNCFNEREQQYLKVIRKYDTTRQKLFPKAFAYLTEALELEAQAGKPSDILGSLFMDMKLGDKGQFFTPQHVATMLGVMAIDANTDKVIEENGFINLSEPCCGAGAMALGFAQAFKNAGYDYTRQMVVTAIDTDIRCVYMCYIQLSLYGIPAVVIHGDSLALKEWSHWYTPLYVLYDWNQRIQHQNTETDTPGMNPTPRQLSLFKEADNEE